MIKHIVESGMTFQVEEDNTFLIEKSKAVLKRTGVKSVEFVELRKWGKGESLRFVEAKMSNPNSSNKERLDEYIHDIREKFQNSISIMFSTLSKRDGMDDVFGDLPQNIQSAKYKKIDCGLWLVVKNGYPDSLDKVSNILKSELKPILKCWNIKDSNIKVVNEDDARNQGLIV